MNKATLDTILNHTTETEIARYFEISPSAVSQWRTKGIPPHRVIGLEKLVKKKVTRHDINPDLYPID